RIKRLPDWTPGSTVRDFKLSWILLSKAGRRFMNECPPYTNDTAQRSLDVFDTVTQTFPYIPATLVIDERGRQMYPLANAVYNDRNAVRYQWSADNLKEVELGILQKASSVAELARLLEVDEDTLSGTLRRWNDQCVRQIDDDFGRPPITMTPIDTPPYYCGKVWPVV